MERDMHPYETTKAREERIRIITEQIKNGTYTAKLISLEILTKVLDNDEITPLEEVQLYLRRTKKR